MDGKLALLTQKWEELQASLGKMLVQTYVCVEEAQDLLINPMVEKRILEVFLLRWLWCLSTESLP